MLKFRKAKQSDMLAIANLITDLLGTCDVKENLCLNCDIKTIRNKNLLHVKQYLECYYICLSNDKVVGACGLSEIKTENEYGVNLSEYREVLYLVVDKNYQKQGIGTSLLKLCVKDNDVPIIYEAWGGDGECVNSKYLLDRCGFVLLKDLGNQYYKDNGYCPLCVNRNKSCTSCLAELYIKQ